MDKASTMNMGARSLKSIVETAMVNILFNLDGIKGNALTLTKKDIEKAFEEREVVISSDKDFVKKTNIGLKEDKTYMA